MLPKYNGAFLQSLSRARFSFYVLFSAHDTTKLSSVDAVSSRTLLAPMQAPPYDRCRAFALAGLDFAHFCQSILIAAGRSLSGQTLALLSLLPRL